MTPAEIISARKIRSIFDKKKSNIRYKKLENFTKWVKRFFTEYIRREKDIGKLELSSKIGRIIYLVKGPKMMHKGNLIKQKSRHTDEENDTPEDIEPMEVLFDTFDEPIPRKAPETRIQKKKKKKKQSKRERRDTERFDMKLKGKDIDSVQSKSKKSV